MRYYFEQLQKKYPSMRNFYQRSKFEFALEEDKRDGEYRWCSMERRRVGSWHFNPKSVDEALELHQFVLDLVPFALSLRPLDCESINFMMGFDFNCQGNHNALITDALGVHPAFDSLASVAGARPLSNEPSLTLALDEECRKQCRVAIESRTNAFQVRTGEFPEEQLSVYVTTGHYGGLTAKDDCAEILDGLAQSCEQVVESYVADQVLSPLARTIALQ